MTKGRIDPPPSGDSLHSSANVHDETDDEQDQEYQEENFRYPGKRHRDATKSQNRRYEGDYQEYQRIVKHVCTSAL